VPRLPSTSTQRAQQERPKYTPRAPGSYTPSEGESDGESYEKEDINAQRAMAAQRFHRQQGSTGMGGDGGLEASREEEMLRRRPTPHPQFRRVDMDGDVMEANQQQQHRPLMSSHGEKYLQLLQVRRQMEKQRHLNTSGESQQQPPSSRVIEAEPVHHHQLQRLVTCDFGVPRREERRVEVRPDPSIAETTVKTRVSQEIELKRMAELVEGLVKYHSPRLLMLDDLITTLAATVEPRFDHMEQIFGMTHLDFFDQYCPSVQIIGRDEQHKHLDWIGTN